MIRNKITGLITYIGMSRTNVYKALFRHFQVWNDGNHRVVYFDHHNYEIRTILCSPNQAIVCERRLIKWFKPADNAEFYEDWEYSDSIAKEEVECPY
ncbi:MAG: hypothetical protein PHX80_05295 [Candidatus Nanoarchaeia archaeon]|nr:hypothetical protein [Candidatus Nanoarchaeia archaeon]